MAEHILFLTGRLAEKNLRRVLQDMQPTEFTCDVHDLGLNVAGLMTAAMIGRRLTSPVAADRIVVPGRCRGSSTSGTTSPRASSSSTRSTRTPPQSANNC